MSVTALAGVSSLMRQCYKEMLALHDLFQSGHTSFTLSKILASVATPEALNCRGSYLHLQMSLEVLKAQEILRCHPSIPHSLCHGLKSIQFASLATSAFRLLTTILTDDEWLTHFHPVHTHCVQSIDKVLWHNYKTLWLPIILSSHPQSAKMLLKFSDNGVHEWDAKLTILRLCRSNGVIEVLDWPDCENLSSKDGPQEDRRPDQSNTVPLTNKRAKQFLCEDEDGGMNIKSIISTGLIHGEESIRSEVFALLCLSRKKTLPLSSIEVSLLKQFLVHNMNVDSQSFRQSVLKSFSSLVPRIRDSCSQELKKRKGASWGSDPDCLKGIGKLALSCEFIIWLVHRLNDDLNMLGNYSRHCTALNLYWILLSTFLDGSSKVSRQNLYKTTDGKCKSLCQFIHHFSKYELKGNYGIVQSNLTCPQTMSLLLTCCTYEMNDVRERASDILMLLKNWSSKTCNDAQTVPPLRSLQHGRETNCHVTEDCEDETDFKMWLFTALRMTDSPKQSEMESGASLLKVILEMDGNEQHLLDLLHEESDSAPNEDQGQQCLERLVDALVTRIERQFEAARDNLLTCSRKGTVSGAIMALTYCLSECRKLASSLPLPFVLATLSRLALLYREMVAFVLRSLAVSSAEGAKVPPSFAEMGESIDCLIAKCRSKLSEEASSVETSQDGERNRAQGKELCSTNQREDQEELQCNLVNQQLILSFCWHLLKTCCWSAAKLTQAFSPHMDDSVFERFLTDTVVFVLIGTRHKGAMESAQDALAIMTQCSFHDLEAVEKSRRLTVLEEQLLSVLDTLETPPQQRRISATRRAAGLAMLFTAICGHLPRGHSALTSRVLLRLMTLAQTKVEAEKGLGEVDLSNALALHILHSLVLSSKLTESTAAHLSRICSVCLESFVSQVWAVRNAALQLFGAVVPRLLGQKKVKDDTASFNSITAAEFCFRNPSLMDVILNLLDQCSQNADGSGWSSDSVPSLVPVLSLLARFNPGTDVQQSEAIRRVIDTLIGRLLSFLGNPVFTVRRLTSLALVTLCASNGERRALDAVLDRLDLRSGNNSVHGCLMVIEAVLVVHPEYFQTRDLIRDRVIRLLTILLAEPLCCYVNRTLCIKILHDLNCPAIKAEVLRSRYLGDARDAGYSLFQRRVTSRQLQTQSINYVDFIMSENQDLWEETLVSIIQEIKAESDEDRFPNLQNTLWLYLKEQNTQPKKPVNRIKMSKVLELLTALLERSELDVAVGVECLPMLNKLISDGRDGPCMRYAVIVFAYFVVKREKVLASFDLFPEFVLRWATVLFRLTCPKTSEDCRICLSKALRVSLGSVLEDSLDSKAFPLLMKATFNLLHDEDMTVRIHSARILVSLNDRNPSTICPSVACEQLLVLILEFAIQRAIFSAVPLLWDLCFAYSFEQVKPSSNSKSFNLFESTTDNAFREPQGIAKIVGAKLKGIEEAHAGKASFDHGFEMQIENFIREKIRLLLHFSEKSYESAANVGIMIEWQTVLKATILENAFQILRSLNHIFNLKLKIDLYILYKTREE